MVNHHQRAATYNLRVCLAKGLPGTTLHDLTLDPDQRKILLDTLPADLTIQLQVQGIVARCGNEAAKIGLRTMSEDRERALDIVLRVHERQIDEVIGATYIQPLTDCY
jgi:hypothetical protein